MGKSKEEIRIEKIIRSLLKLPENRRCVNCKTLGPQYVCTTFWTFVCTNCSGVHREFNHRVKSISMAKFTSEEVNALQAAGNERAKHIYFRTWDAQHNCFPDNSNIHKLRDFIKHVYVDRLYTDETHPALVPRLRNIDNEEPYERRSGDSSGKPSFHGRSLDRYGKYSFKEVRSSGCEREKNASYGGLRSTSSRFEGTRGQYRVDGARIAGRLATDMFTTADLKPRGKSPDGSHPPVLHVREILGENFPRLCVGDQPKSSERGSFYGSASKAQVGFHLKASNRYVDSPTYGQEGRAQKSGDHSRNLHRRSTSAYAQSVVQSSNQTSVDNAEVKPKSGSAGSLINFANFPPSEASEEQELDTHVADNGGNSASSWPQPVEETRQSTPAKNTLEYLLCELSSPIDTPSNNHSRVSAVEEAKESPSTQQTQQHSIIPVLDVATPNTRQPQQHSVVSLLDVAIPSTHQPLQHSVVPVLDGATSATQSSWSNGFTDNQSEALSIVPSVAAPIQEKNSYLQWEALSIVPSVAIPTQEKNSAARAQPSTTEARSSGRTELPAELFCSFNPRGPLSGWQMGPSHGLGVNMQYHPTASMQIPAFPGMTKSRNPFDTDDNTTQHFATNTMFVSMPSLQGGLPNLSTSPGVSHASSFGSDPQGFVPTYSSSCPSGAYMGQHLYNNMPATRQQGMSGYGGQEGIPGSLNSNQHTQFTYPTHTNMSSFPNGGGNPFG